MPAVNHLAEEVHHHHRLRLQAEDGSDVTGRKESAVGVDVGECGNGTDGKDGRDGGPPGVGGGDHVAGADAAAPA